MATRSACRGDPAQLHPRRHRRGIAYNSEEFDRLREPRPGRLAHPRGPDRGIGHRLERVRAGGDARHQGQRRHHLLDRELRPDGRPHGRLDHRGAGPDADRQGIPADARRLDRHDPRDRRGDGRVEHPVRRPSADRPDGGHRDESARVPLQRPGLEGHRLPHRQDRRQAGRRLHARRNPNDITRETPACFEPTIDYW